jgi:hypothetical protein
VNKSDILLWIVCFFLGFLFARYVLKPYFAEPKKDKLEIKLPNIELELDRPRRMDKIDDNTYRLIYTTAITA